MAEGNAGAASSSNHAAGKTTLPAMSDCTMPATIFSTASHLVSIGASRRSSISFVISSMMIGMDTAVTPVMSMARAMIPGRSMLL